MEFGGVPLYVLFEIAKVAPFQVLLFKRVPIYVLFYDSIVFLVKKNHNMRCQSYYNVR